MRDNTKMFLVMVVDDDPSLRELMCKIMEIEGHLVVAKAVNGGDAIIKYKKFRPTLVIMDVMMPEVDGINAAKQILEIDGNVQIVMYSSIDGDALDMAAEEAGACGVLTKPYVYEQVQDVLNCVLHGHGNLN